jgi:hypothetical protein
VIDFELEPGLIDLKEGVAVFVQEVAIPAEPRDVSTHGTPEDLRAELQEEAKEWGIFGPPRPFKSRALRSRLTGGPALRATVGA